jgi:hypothetical protein
VCEKGGERSWQEHLQQMARASPTARFEVLQAMVGKGTTPDESDFLTQLTEFFNAIAQNKVPREVAPLLTCTQGLVIPKRDGKDRPLGLREGLTNLAAKCALRSLKPETSRIFIGKNYTLAEVQTK